MRTPGESGEKITTNLGKRQGREPVCPACGRPLTHHAHRSLNTRFSAEEQAFAALAADFDVISAHLANDPEFARQIEALTALSMTDYTERADLTDAALAVATHPLARAMVLRSNRFVRELGGRDDLTDRRRFGVIRRPFPPDEALPIAKPPASPFDPKTGAETRFFPLRDELEWLPIRGIRENGVWRPESPTITLQQARAILGWKATRLDRRRSKSYVPGSIVRGRKGGDVRIETEAFMNWTVVRRSGK